MQSLNLKMYGLFTNDSAFKRIYRGLQPRKPFSLLLKKTINDFTRNQNFTDSKVTTPKRLGQEINKDIAYAIFEAYCQKFQNKKNNEKVGM